MKVSKLGCQGTMPYLGMRPAGERVTPLDVDQQDTVLCPLCEGELSVRDAHYTGGRFVARHFFHKLPTDCSGKSPLPIKRKTIAALKLREVFPQATVTDEVQVGNRVADVVATFEEPLAPLGKGLIVEVPYTRDHKERSAITRNYLDAGYSVYWANQSDFDGHDVSFAEHRARTVWPDAVPDVDDRTGYPDCVRTLLDPTTASVELDVPIPLEYWRAHALEVASPSQGRPGNTVTAPGWESLEWVSLSGGPKKVWVNLLRAPSDYLFLEFWTKVRQTDETAFMPLRVTADMAPAFERFLQTARTAFSKKEVPRSNDHDSWVSVASLEFAGTQPCESWLSIAKPPNDQPKVIVGRRDRRGNTRTLAVNYRPLYLSRLIQIRAALEAIEDTAGSVVP